MEKMVPGRAGVTQVLQNEYDGYDERNIWLVLDFGLRVCVLKMTTADKD
jgi:hypothetical protein